MKRYFNSAFTPAMAFSILLGFTLLGCKKFVEIDPPNNQIAATTVYNNTDLAISTMTGIFAAMPNSFDKGAAVSFSASMGAMADEFNGSKDQLLYLNELSRGGMDVWTNSYKELIYRCNSLIDGLGKSDGIPDGIKKILIGEAKFSRAFVYFTLVNLYGDVPLVLTPDYAANANIPRSGQETVYIQIIQDLKDAQSMLSDSYLNIHLSTDPVERIRPNKLAATALLARVYLYKGLWSDAENEASKVISDSKLSLVAPEEVFLKNSIESIWALQPNQVGNLGTNTADARYFLTTDFMGNYPSGISDQLLTAFEPGDKRKEAWLIAKKSGTTIVQVPYKYEVGQGNASQPQIEYNIVLRLSEQYLIRAEARAMLGHLTGDNSATNDLNLIRNRAGLDNSTASGSTEILNAIMKERRIELFSEWGHRWFDLKRTGQIDAVMNAAAPTKVVDGVSATWQPYKSLLPIPLSEFQYNSALQGHQNPGYPEK